MVFRIFKFMKFIRICVNFVQVAGYGLVSNQVKARWLRIIAKPLLTPKRAIKDKNGIKISVKILSI